MWYLHMKEEPLSFSLFERKSPLKVSKFKVARVPMPDCTLEHKFPFNEFPGGSTQSIRKPLN